MGDISYYNSERYPDPTAYAGLTAAIKAEKAKKYKPVVYICSPYSGNIKRNTANARRYCRFAVDSGCIPIAPHLFLPQFMSEETDARGERSLSPDAMFMNFVFLSKCREIWVFGDKITAGMADEIEKAKQRKIPIRYFSDEIREVTKR